MPNLDERLSQPLVAVVTGGSRGIGKGVAVALGAKGATVYITGRSAKKGDSSLPGTIHETAEAVTQAGGNGIAVTCDHADDDQVRRVFEQIRNEYGYLDILVNNAATVDTDILKPGPFWEKSIGISKLMDVGLRSNYVASWYAAPLLIERKKGLVVGISFYGAVAYFHGPGYGAQKAGIDKMAADMAVDFRPYGVASVSLWPGIVKTELVMEMAKQYPAIAAQMDTFETPEFSGFVIDALYRDRDLMSLSGQALIGAELAVKYGFKDINGKQPSSYRNTLGSPPVLHPSFSAE